MNISVIIPTLNEEQTLARCAAPLTAQPGLEVIVADGGSEDQTITLARHLGFQVVTGARGRGAQLNLGAARATSEILLFLHSDTLLPPNFAPLIREILRRPRVVAGAFRLHIAAPGAGYRLIELGANLRSRLGHLPYGDQAIFIRRQLFERAGGFASQPILEDYELMCRLKGLGRIVLAPAAVTTSARRWHQLGLWRTTLINQLMLLGYHAGLSPQRLARFYYQARAR